MKNRNLLKTLIFCSVIAVGLNAQAKYSKVFVQCAVVQGNGFNWASTLGWLSGEVAQMADKAYTFQHNHPGKTAGVDLSCLTGSSSGSFVAALMDRLLRNPNITGRTDDRRKVLTPEQTARASQALHFLSLATHFRSELLGIAIQGKSPESIRNTFLRVVSAAEHYHPSWNDQHIIQLPVFNSNEGKEGVTPNSSKDVYRANQLRKAFGISQVTSAPYLPNRNSMDSLSRQDKRLLDEMMQQLMQESKDVLDHEMRRINKKANSVVGDDFCVTAFIIPKPNRSYDKLKIAYICNQKTYKKLASSSSFKKILSQSQWMQHRLLLGWTSHWNESLNVSMREPGLMAELAGSIDHIGIKGLIGINGKSTYSYRLRNQKHIVIGGFPGPRMQAWAASALLQERMQNLRGQGIPVEGRLVIFGRTEERDNPTSSFAQKTITQLFTDANVEELTPTLRDYYQWQDDFCRVTDRLPQDIIVDFYRMDWNLPGKNPAAMNNASYLLTAKGLNLVQIQTNFKKHQKVSPMHPFALAFDKIDDLRFVPEPPASGMKCRL